MPSTSENQSFQLKTISIQRGPLLEDSEIQQASPSFFQRDVHPGHHSAMGTQRMRGDAESKL